MRYEPDDQTAMPPHGKPLALTLAALGVCVLVVGVVGFEDRLMEEWCLHKLRSGDLEEQKGKTTNGYGPGKVEW